MEEILDNIIESELTGTGDNPEPVETPDGKLFSQEQVNDLIRERLSREREKVKKEHEALVKEYQAKELNLKGKELLTEKGLSHEILDILKYNDEETLNKAVSIVDGLMKKAAKPSEVITHYTPTDGTPPSSTEAIRDAFNLRK